MTLENITHANLRFLMFKVNSGNCGAVSSVVYQLPSFSSIVAKATVDEEFIEAEVGSTCQGGVGVGIGTSNNCTLCAGWTVSTYNGISNGCGGSLPNIEAEWRDCFGMNEGVLFVIDY